MKLIEFHTFSYGCLSLFTDTYFTACELAARADGHDERHDDKDGEGLIHTVGDAFECGHEEQCGYQQRGPYETALHPHQSFCPRQHHADEEGVAETHGAHIELAGSEAPSAVDRVGRANPAFADESEEIEVQREVERGDGRHNRERGEHDRGHEAQKEGVADVR